MQAATIEARAKQRECIPSYLMTMTEHPRFPSSLTTKVLRMRENSRQLQAQAGAAGAGAAVVARRRARLRALHCQGRRAFSTIYKLLRGTRDRLYNVM